MKINSNVLIGYRGLEVEYKIFQKEEDVKKLVIMLPGLGYSTQAPLFHYSTGLFLNKGYDVLQVNYQYTKKIYDSFSNEELSQALVTDVKIVINHVLSVSTYDEFCIIGKSLGTIAMSSELRRPDFVNAKAIWLTPLLQNDDVFTSMLHTTQNGICIIGEADPVYRKDRFEELLQNNFLKSTLIPDVNHGLEYAKDAVKSIDVLKNVLTLIHNTMT